MDFIKLQLYTFNGQDFLRVDCRPQYKIFPIEAPFKENLIKVLEEASEFLSENRLILKSEDYVKTK